MYRNLRVGACWAAILITVGMVPQAVAGNDAVERQGTLPNGLRYAIRHTDLPAGEVEFRVLVKAGEIDVDDARLHGSMHLIEHMAFRDNAVFPDGSLIPYLRGQGLRFGMHLNGQTRPGVTTYRLTASHAGPEGVAAALNALHGMIGGIRFTPQLVEQEKKVVAEEIRGYQNNPGIEVVFNRLELRLAGSGVPAWSYGSPDTLSQVQAADLAALYQRLYRSNRMTVIVAGDIDTALTEKALRQVFADVPADPQLGALPFDRPAWPLASETAYAVNIVPDGQGNALNVALTLPRIDYATRAGEVQAARIDLLRYALQQRMLGAPIEWEWRDDGREYLNFSWILDIKGLKLGQRKQDKVGPNLYVLNNLENELARFASTPLDDATMAQLKREYLGSTVQYYSNQRQRANTEADKLLNAAQGIHTPVTPAQELAWIRQAMEGFDGKALSGLLAELLQQPRQVQWVQERKYLHDVPSREATLAWYRDFKPVPQPAAIGDYALLTMPGPKADPGSIVGERADGGFTILTLSNGLRVALHPMPEPNGQVYFRMDAPGGLYQFAQADYAAALLTGAAVQNTTVAQLPPFELSRMRVAAGATVIPFVEPEWQGFRGNAPAAGMDQVFAELHHRFLRDPVRDVLNAGRNGLIAPETPLFPYAVLVNRKMRPAAFGNDYRSRPLDPEWYGLFRGSDLELVMRRLYEDPARYTLVLSGAVDQATIRPLLTKWLASLPRRDNALPINVAPFKPLRGGTLLETDLQGKIANDRIEFYSVGNWSPEVMIRLWLLTTVLDERLRKQLRDQTGASYTPWSTYTAIPGPARLFSVQLGFDADPEQEAAALSSVLNELTQLRENEVTQDELVSAKRIVGRELQTALAQPESMLWYATLINLAGLSFDQLGQFQAAVLRTDSKNLRDAAVRYLDPERMTVGRLLPAPAPR